MTLTGPHSTQITPPVRTAGHSVPVLALGAWALLSVLAAEGEEGFGTGSIYPRSEVVTSAAQ